MSIRFHRIPTLNSGRWQFGRSRRKTRKNGINRDLICPISDSRSQPHLFSVIVNNISGRRTAGVRGRLIGVDVLTTKGNGSEWKYGIYLFYMVQVFLLYLFLTGFLIGDIQRATWGIMALALSFLPGIVEWWLRMQLPWTVKFLIALSLFLHVAGGINRWYFLYYPFYDKVAHFVSALTIAFMLYLLLLCIGTYTRFRPGKFAVPVVIVVITMFFGQAWEYAELTLDLILKSTYYMGSFDSVVDTVFNLLGALIIAVLSYVELKNDVIADVFHRYVRW